MRRGDPAQLLRRISEIAVRNHRRFLEVILPLIDEIGVVAGAQVLFQPGILLDAGSRSEYPFLAVKERVGVPNGVLHERPSGLGVGARHIFVVDHHFGRAGELAVEIHRWVVLVRLRQHQWVNPVGAGERGKIGPRSLDGRGVIGGGESGRVREQFFAVEIELFPGQARLLGIDRPTRHPTNRQCR